MCPIAISKNIEKVKKKYISDSSDSMEKNHTISPQKILQGQIFFVSTFGKSHFTHLTTNVMSSGQRFVILAMFIMSVLRYPVFPMLLRIGKTNIEYVCFTSGGRYTTIFA